MALLLGIDLGTSYFKVGLFTPDGALRGLGRVPVKKTEPAPGRCELAVEEFWRALRRGLSEALTESGEAAAEIVGVSYSSQASTFLLLDDHDAPLTGGSHVREVRPHREQYRTDPKFQRRSRLREIHGAVESCCR